MKIFIPFFCSIIVLAVSADVVENVVVDTSQAPSNYVVSYKINPPDGYVGCTAYINAIISSDNGNSYPFYFRNPARDPNFSVECSENFYELANAGNQSFNFRPRVPVVIPNAKIMVVAEIVDKFLQTTGTVWKCITSAPPWYNGWYVPSIVFDNKIWVFGGSTYHSNNYIWSSTDGTNWTEVIDNAPWQWPGAEQIVVFNNNIWVTEKSNVWTSPNGINWTKATASTPWDSGHRHSCVAFDNKIWVIGDEQGYYQKCGQALMVQIGLKLLLQHRGLGLTDIHA